MNLAETIRAKLDAAFSPPHLHAGHAGWREGGETHFRVTIVASGFQGRTRVERHRLVHEVLDAELKGRVHALALTLLTPEEAARRM
jgi:BolA family transcriptional regulator, general stress-responsive regulator